MSGCSVYTCNANSPLLNCIGWRQPSELDTLTNFHNNRELIVSIASQATSAWNQPERWDWRGWVKHKSCPWMFSEDTRSEMMVHVLQLACLEGFGFSHRSNQLQIEKGIRGHSMSHPGELRHMYSALSKGKNAQWSAVILILLIYVQSQCALELFWKVTIHTVNVYIQTVFKKKSNRTSKLGSQKKKQKHLFPLHTQQSNRAL